MAGEKLAVIGLDGATWKILEKGIQAGKLDRFKEKREEGVYSTLVSTIPAITCPALPTLFTGKNPAKLGIFDFRDSTGAIVSYDKITGPAVWDLLGEDGYDCCVANVRITYPPRIKKGVMISGLLTPSEQSEYVYPKEMKEEVKDFHGEKYGEMAGNVRKVSKFLDLFSITEHKFGKFKELFKRHGYDFLFFWDGNTDRIQHYHWGEDDILLDYYQKIEKMFFDFLDCLEGYNIIILSDHGFESAPRNAVYLNNWLRDNGYLKYKKNARGKLNLAYKKTRANAGEFLRNNLHHKHYDKVFRLVKKIEGSSDGRGPKDFFMRESETSPTSINKNKTTAFLDQRWGVKIQKELLSGDYEKFREELIEKLKKLEDDEGKKIFKDVFKREEIFKGKFMNRAPDIVFVAGEGFEVKGGSPKALIEPISKKRIIGDHSNDRRGIFIAYGPDIRKEGKIRDMRIVDVAPTILHLMNCQVPTDMDGKVMQDIFKDGSDAGKRSVRYGRKAGGIVDDIKI